MGGIANSLSSHSANLMARAGNTCDTDICKAAATSILHDLDVNIDPCSDFYQYTCKKISFLDIILWIDFFISLTCRRWLD